MKSRNDVINPLPFGQVDLNDPFFDSLRNSYGDFDGWFQRKAWADEQAYFAQDANGSIVGMLYLKAEDDEDLSVSPPLVGRRLKIGTFKVDFDHHTGIGKRFLAIALREFARGGFEYVYLTAHDSDNTAGLISLITEYGFSRQGFKESEGVFVKRRPRCLSGNPCLDYPFVAANPNNSWYLAIRPEYHIRMFGDTNLQSEMATPVYDEKATNSILKMYLSGARDCDQLLPGDSVVIYRTNDNKGRANYRSVVSSICTVVEVKSLDSFASMNEFISYVGEKSVFTLEELQRFWEHKRYPWVISMLYNFQFERYPTRGKLLAEGLLPEGRLVCMRIDSPAVFQRILELGGVNEGFIID